MYSIYDLIPQCSFNCLTFIIQLLFVVECNFTVAIYVGVNGVVVLACVTVPAVSGEQVPGTEGLMKAEEFGIVR